MVTMSPSKTTAVTALWTVTTPSPALMVCACLLVPVHPGNSAPRSALWFTCAYHLLLPPLIKM